MPLLLIALLVSAMVAGANTIAFELRAGGLEEQWRAEQAAGVPAGDLAPARSQLTAERDRRVGLLPYAPLSNATLVDPFGAPEASASAGVATASGASRRRAEAALARLRLASGPAGDERYESGLVALGRLSSPADLDALARRWDADAARQQATARRLADEAGGLSHGLPADVAGALARLETLEASADAAGISTRAAAVAIAHGQQYLARGYPDLLGAHQAVLAELGGAADGLQRRLDLRASVDRLLAQVPDLLDLATQYGAGDELRPRVTQVRAALDAARAAHDDDRLDAALTGLQQLMDDLHATAGGRLPTAGIPCWQGAPAQLIVIHLATQQLIAYGNGCPVMRTPVTTGRAALPTDRGTFHVFYKSPSYHMVSPWPRESPFYYPPTWVSYAMEFVGDGTFIHSADWQPDVTYGPGSQYGPYASHGCVHVIGPPLKQLYDWTSVGATVIVGD